MSPTGRSEGEYRSAQHEGNPFIPTGRPEGEYRSAEREDNPFIPTGRQPLMDGGSARSQSVCSTISVRRFRSNGSSVCGSRAGSHAR
jgi:hypothetical protein